MNLHPRISHMLATTAARGAMLIVVALSAGSSVSAQDDTWFERQAEWHGYPQFHFTLAERPAYLVAPREPAAGKPWVWRARFPGYHTEMDIELLAQGFHIGYVDVAGMFGSPQAMKIGDEFYQYVTRQRGLSARPALEGVSRGGLFVYNWAARHPDRVASIYCDTPVCDFKSWPAGLGTGLGSQQAWNQCLQAYQLTAEEAKAYDRNPIDHAQVIAAANIPLLHIVSENDRVVPPSENTYLLRDRLQELGHELEVISVAEGTEQSNGHHFDHPRVEQVVNFIVTHSRTQDVSGREMVEAAKRIVFLGDSITYAGLYAAYFDAWLSTQGLSTQGLSTQGLSTQGLSTQGLSNRPIVINVGLPSETVSGLSEEGHAGGRFPRPDLAERLDRVLATTDPDLVFACYGINCGIYQPFDEQRFQSYQDGIKQLKDKVEAHGAKLVLVTPPYYDDQRAKNSFSYNGVLDRYSQWLLDQREQGWVVIDLHGPMAQEVARQRESDPEFTFQPDAVHPNDAGHWFIAGQFIRWCGDDGAASAQSPQAFWEANDIPPEVMPTVRQRCNLRRDAYLSAAGHQRPGIRDGLPVEQAEQQAQELTRKIDSQLGNDR